MSTLINDIKYGFRILRNRPGFAAVVILCLGLGIGGVTAILSVFNGVFVHFIPYQEPDQLVFFVTPQDSGGFSVMTPAQNYLDWKAQNRSFVNMSAYQTHQCHTPWAGWRNTEEGLKGLEGLSVTHSFFDVLGMRPFMGRVLSPEDEGHPVIILSHHVWRDNLGADPQIIGRQLLLDGFPLEVIGVMSPNYRYLPWYEAVSLNRKVDYWLPVSKHFKEEPRNNWNYSAIGRLKPGVSIEQAQADMDAIVQLQKDQGFYPKQAHLLVQPLRKTLLGPIRSGTFLVLVASGFVLLIACANVINLFLVHSMSRKKEMAVRSVLGSSRFRMVRQLICENTVLMLLSGAFGILLAIWGVDLLIELAPQNMPGVDQIRIDWPVYAASFAVTVLCAFVIGLIPALSTSRLNPVIALKDFGSRVTSGLRERRFIRMIVVSELVLAFILVVGAGLLIRSYWSVAQMELGIQPRHILGLRLSGPNLTKRHDELLTRLQAIPGVELTASATGLPITGEPSDSCRMSPVPQEDEAGKYPRAYLRTVSVDYFHVLGMRLKQGRYFTIWDNADSAQVVIVNEALAQSLWPEKDAIGQKMSFHETNQVFGLGDQQYAERTVIGITGNVRSEGPDQESPLEAYIPFNQRTRTHVVTSVALQCQADPRSIMGPVRREIQSLDSSFKIENMQTMRAFYSEAKARRRFLMGTLSAFAGVAFTLAVVGIYGVVAFTVSLRIHEMGIRIAFGAQRADILRLVMKYAMGLILSSVGIGIVGTFALRKLIVSQLFNISPMDPLTLAIGILLVILVPLIACYVPARRAAKVDPMEALKYE